ncbi:glutamate--tRNA ligase [Rickettsiales bacterium]|nr:glutamate--tRNA ligase [Rickettsiales bacterium]
MTIITRFAPSPTGLLHIGSARTALFNYLFAKNNNGKFLLRIEDTDKKRSTNEAKEEILKGLEWLGLKYDEKPFYQSQNEKRHREIALKLLDEGKAYYCYTSAEELAQKRQEYEAKKQVFRFQSPWRDQKPPENSDIKPVIRIKSPKSGSTIINDLVQGEIEISNSELDDMVILRSDGTPTYNLAVIVDDYDMNVSHIIRGDDHMNNSFRQKIIYDALGWEMPQCAHIPLIHGADGSKMSKRHGATNVMEYAQMGYLSCAMRNYLLRLGWSHQDAEIISDEEAIKWFNLEKIGRSPSRFDFDKLNNLNKHYIKAQDNQKLLQSIGLNNVENADKLLQAIDFIKERSSNLNELKEALEIYKNNYKKPLQQADLDKISTKKQLLLDLYEIIDIIKVWELDLIKNEILNYSKEHNLKMKDFGPVLRLVLTFSSSSAGGIFEIIHILGKDEVKKRFNYYLNEK